MLGIIFISVIYWFLSWANENRVESGASEGKKAESTVIHPTGGTPP